MSKRLGCLIAFVLLVSIGSGASADLLVHWRLDEGSGTIAADSSGNGYDGTFTGEPQWVAGHDSAGALHFDGVDDYVSHSLPGDQTYAAFTVAVWVKADDVAQADLAGVFSSHFPGGATGAGFQIDLSAGSMVYQIRPPSGTGVFGDATTDWVHLAAVGEGTSVQLYYQGAPVATGTLASDLFNVFAVGVNRNSSRWFAGTIDDLRVYDHALTEAEIMAAMAGGTGGYPFALSPNPDDGALLEATWANISWRAGAYAVSHDLYLGDNFDDVNDGIAESFQGNQAGTTLIVGFPGFPIAGGLVPGTTYYWRVDEVNDVDPNSPWKGDVWSFTVPPKQAYDPSPADDAINVLQDVTLNWAAGFGAKLHNVYFGDNFDDVNNAEGALPQTDTTYTPGALEVAKTYYWRVDEFEGAVTHKGNVWILTTVPDVAVTNPNLILWWNLDEGRSSTAVDWSGNGNHGAITGGAQWVDGYQGTALSFDSDVYVETSAFEGVTGTAPRTCCAWIRTPAAGNYNIMSWGTTTTGQKWRMRVDGTGGLRIEVAGGYHIGLTNLADGRWHHVAVTFEDDGSPDVLDTLLYVDGRLETTASSQATAIDTAASTVRVGRSSYNEEPIPGEIDDARIYDKVLTAEEIQQVMLGDTKLAGDPVPERVALVDMRDISSLSWSRGDSAASHDVYLGTDRDAVADADNTAPEFQGNQTGTSLSLTGLVEFGGGDYYWRIDEVEAGGTVIAGTIWKFTVPDYLIVDNFESYDNIDPAPGEPGINRIFDKWIDGFGTLNNGALVGNDLPPYAETNIVYSGAQSMIYRYDNVGKASEATLTLSRVDWTAEGVAKLSLWLRGDSANSADRIYVALNGSAVVYHDDAAATQLTGWNEWIIDLATFGIDLTNVQSISIGIGTRNAPAPTGGTGTMYFDDIRLIR